jgi:hydrogenase maturation protease
VNLIIGIGSTLRRDDGLGPDLARSAADALPADLIVVTQLTPELAEPISRAGRVVFIDAAETPDARPGTITTQIIAPDPTAPGAIFTHQIAPDGLLAAAHHWYGRAPAALLITVQGADFGLGDGLSAAIAAQIEALRAAVRAQAAGFLSAPAP